MLAGFFMALSFPAFAQTAADDLNRARAYVLYGRWEEAVCVVDDMLARYPHSPHTVEARYLKHKAKLFEALALADDDPPLRSPVPLIRSLEALTREPVDDVIAAAKLALGTVNYLATNQPKPDRLVTEALRAWQRLDVERAQPRAFPPIVRAHPPFMQDVIAIRTIVFRSYGRRLSPAAPYLFVRPDIQVWFDIDAHLTRVVTYEPVPGHSNVIFLDAERRLLIDRILSTIGTARQRSWMRRGPRRDVLAFWSKASFGAVGKWGGWSVGTQLRIASMSFLPAAGTVAKVRVLVGDLEETVWLEKRNGDWVATGRQELLGVRPVSTSMSSTSLRMRPTWRVITSDSASAASPHRRFKISAAASTDISEFRSSCPS